MENAMKKISKKLKLDRATVLNLQRGLVTGGRGPDDPSVWWACQSDAGCGESHAASCGNGTWCTTYSRIC
jgi:hypothetical protein